MASPSALEPSEAEVVVAHEARRFDVAKTAVGPYLVTFGLAVGAFELADGPIVHRMNLRLVPGRKSEAAVG